MPVQMNALYRPDIVAAMLVFRPWFPPLYQLFIYSTQCTIEELQQEEAHVLPECMRAHDAFVSLVSFILFCG